MSKSRIELFLQNWVFLCIKTIINLSKSYWKEAKPNMYLFVSRIIPTMPGWFHSTIMVETRERIKGVAMVWASGKCWKFVNQYKKRERAATLDLWRFCKQVHHIKPLLLICSLTWCVLCSQDRYWSTFMVPQLITNLFMVHFSQLPVLLLCSSSHHAPTHHPYLTFVSFSVLLTPYSNN